MFVHRSNRAENLLEALADLLATPSGGPFDPEVVVVQAPGVARWVSTELSRRLGVCAHVEFPYAATVVRRALDAVLGEEAAALWAPERLAWAVLALLPERLGWPSFAPLRDYLREDPRARGMAAWQLARRLAQVLDTYTVYRQHLVRAWSAGEGEGWQPELLRALEQRLGPHHLAHQALAFARALQATEVDLGDLPARICLFGVSTLPPLHLDVLVSLSRHREVHLFALCPSAEYWADIRSRREILRKVDPAVGLTAEALHLDEGHPLLASLGRLGRDFQAVLEASSDYAEPPADLFEDPGTATLLHALQSDMLHLRDRRGAPMEVRPEDRSLVVHSCHGPMRQVEVLQSELLRLFHEIPDLEPRDVVVLTPDIGAWAPLVEAVFDRSPGDPRHIPYRIADRTLRGEAPVVEAFLHALALAGTRLTAPQVLDLLDLPAVHTRFGLASEDLDEVRWWVQRSGIRWGADAGHRERLGQPAFSENTWRFGLDRLLLGWALPGEGREMFGGVLPFDEVEGGTAGLVGHLADFGEALFDLLRRLEAGPRTVPEWTALLAEVLARMVHREEATAWQHDQVLGYLADLDTWAGAAGHTTEIDLEAVRHAAEAHFARAGSARGFLSGRVTFAAMVPLRAVPFRVVCLVGLDDGAFPRPVRRVGFDLVAAHPRVGDRSPREDDRTLFLESILSARDRLVLTYTGQSIRDNEEQPPSVALAELLDHVDEAFTVAGGGDLRSHLVCTQPLQPFSPRHYGADRDPRLRSFNDDFVQGARALQGPRVPARAFFAEPLARERPEQISLSELLRFWRQPVEGLLRGRLDLWMGEGTRELPEREPLELAGLDAWAVASPLVDQLVAGEHPRGSRARAAGALPLGTPGEVAFEDLASRAIPFAEVVRQERTSAHEPVEVDCRVGPWRLVGQVGDLWGPGLLRYRWARLERHAWVLLHLWIEHLVVHAQVPDARLMSRLVLRPERRGSTTRVIRLRPVREAQRHLAALVELYLDGRAHPLPFFPETSLAYAAAAGPEASPWQVRRARRAARDAWEDTFDGPPGEGSGPYVRRVFGETEPWEADPAWVSEAPWAGHDFHTLAHRVWGPALDHSVGVT